MDTGNYSATSNSIKLVHWPLMGGLLHLVQRGGNWAGAHPSMASVPITASLYNGPLLCGFKVSVKRLSGNLLQCIHKSHDRNNNKFYNVFIWQDITLISYIVGIENKDHTYNKTTHKTNSKSHWFGGTQPQQVSCSSTITIWS